MIDLSGTRVWLTGASSGIGHALAVELLAGGARVAVSGRRRQPLTALRDAAARTEDVLVVPFDVCDGEAAVAAAAEIREEWGGVDWVVANAGDCLYLDPQRWEDAVVRRMMEVNFFGFCHTARAGLPLLSDSRGRGLLAATVSAAVLAPLPRGCAYGASKAAVAYFLESLRGHYPQVDFSLIFPGFVRTPLTDKNDFPMPTILPVGKAAKIIVRGLRRRQANIRFPRRLTVLLRLLSMLPAAWQQRLLVGMARR